MSRCSQVCQHWGCDMDMDSFCMHPKAVEIGGNFGQFCSAMARQGLCSTTNGHTLFEPAADFKFRIGDIVSRHGDDECEVIMLSGDCMRIRCIRPSEALPDMYKKGEEETNLVRRFTFVRRPWR